jgi:hypothetical protein
MISFYDVIVTASNSQTTPILSTNVTVRINVDDENDNPPEFNASSYQGRVSENATVGTVVARVFAKDRDKVPVFSGSVFSALVFTRLAASLSFIVISIHYSVHYMT